MKNDVYLKLQALVRSFRHGSKKSLLELYGRRPSKVEEILETRSLRKREGHVLWMSDVLQIVKRNKKLFDVDDPKINDLAKFVVFYEERFAVGKKLFYPESVVSIDLGPVNSAYCLINNQYQVKEWKMLDFRLPSPYSPGECYRNVAAALKTVPMADVYVLEEQSHRLHNRGYMGISLQLRCLEAMIYAMLSQHKHSIVQSVLPSRVASYFELAKGKAKKKASVELVKELVGQKQTTPLGEVVHVSEALIEYFNASKKKDDLSDCLLQGFSVLDWSTMCLHLLTSTATDQ